MWEDMVTVLSGGWFGWGDWFKVGKNTSKSPSKVLRLQSLTSQRDEGLELTATDVLLSKKKLREYFLIGRS